MLMGHCGDGKRFVVRADEILPAFLELESAIRPANDDPTRAVQLLGDYE